MTVERIKWSHAGFRKLLRSREVMSDLIERGERVKARSGPGFETSAVTGRNRARVSVATGTPEAMVDNARNNTLIRSLDAGR